MTEGLRRSENRARAVAGRAGRSARARAIEILGGTAVPDPAADPTESSPDRPRNVPDAFFHQLLHELRTLELERLDADGGRALSIGASGSWYFDWFEAAVGRVDEHIGVEAFEAMPDDLPDYVRWNPSTADRFDGVDDDSVDIVFAGQTTEHLWAVELTDFLLESHRVLRDDGRLVLDSPNRLVTEHLHWSHGGHTVELSAEEIAQLLELAGFEIESRRGLLVTRIDGRVLQLEEGLDRGDITARRTRAGVEVLDDSFIWWIVARRRDGTPDRADLLAAVERLFWFHWPTRIGRGMWAGPEPASIEVPAGANGPIARTLPFPIAAGTWSFGLDVEGPDPAAGLEIRVLDAGGTTLHVLRGADAEITGERLTWRFDRPTLEFAAAVELVAVDPAGDLGVRMPFDLRANSGIGVRAAG